MGPIDRCIRHHIREANRPVRWWHATRHPTFHRAPQSAVYIRQRPLQLQLIRGWRRRPGGHFFCRPQDHRHGFWKNDLYFCVRVGRSQTEHRRRLALSLRQTWRACSAINLHTGPTTRWNGPLSCASSGFPRQCVGHGTPPAAPVWRPAACQGPCRSRPGRPVLALTGSRAAQVPPPHGRAHRPR